MVEKENKRRHRALILQGGAALGAYEAGAFRALCNWLKKDNDTSDDENLFDIVAGTSIGAINAAIIVSYVKENKTWNYSADRLWEFWKAMSSMSIVETIPGYTLWWDYLHNTMKLSRESWNNMLSFLNAQTDSYHYPQEWMKWFKDYLDYFVNEYFDIPASGEAARRYYSVRHFLMTGANNVFQPLVFGMHDFFSPIALAKPDYKYYDNLQNLWFRYGNLPLRRLLLNQNYLFQPSIKTDSDSQERRGHLENPKEPRLLLVTVDVETGATVTIDSYPYNGNECKICKKPYENIIDHIESGHKIPCKGSDNSFSLRWSGYRDNENNSYIIFHDGITIDHILASASVPIHYDYQEINVWKFKHQNKEIPSLGNEEEEDTENEGHKEERKFWDGQFVSNTPLREVINEHQRYWKDKMKKSLDNNNSKGIRDLLQDKYKIPDLDVYIVSLWPKEEKGIPKDHDGQIDRRNDISFYDKTEYDQKVVELVSDYIKMVKELASKVKSEDLKKIMNHIGTSKSRTHKKFRSYKDLLSGAIDVKVTRIERKDDPHAISQKWADYSFGTVSRLYIEGMKDTLNKLLEKEIIEEIDSLANKSQSNNEKEILIDLANYISRIVGNEGSKFESHDFSEHPSIVKQRINETGQVKRLSTGTTEKILDIIDQSGAKYIEVLRVCLDYNHASPHFLTISR
jgi:NTE family protein